MNENYDNGENRIKHRCKLLRIRVHKFTKTTKVQIYIQGVGWWAPGLQGWGVNRIYKSLILPRSHMHSSSAHSRSLHSIPQCCTWESRERLHKQVQGIYIQRRMLAWVRDSEKAQTMICQGCQTQLVQWSSNEMLWATALSSGQGNRNNQQQVAPVRAGAWGKRQEPNNEHYPGRQETARKNQNKNKTVAQREPTGETRGRWQNVFSLLMESYLECYVWPYFFCCFLDE